MYLYKENFFGVSVVKCLLYQIYVESLAVRYEGAMSGYSFPQSAFCASETGMDGGGKCLS